jgi:hypothetical protein
MDLARIGTVGLANKIARIACGTSLLALLLMSPARAEVKPGDVITPANADKVRELVSPGTYDMIKRGMQIQIVAPSHVEWPPPYQTATERYSAQVRLAPDHLNMLGYVAGQPFPLLDPNDPDVGTKIMWNSYFRPIASDDFDLRFIECEVSPFNPGGAQKLLSYNSAGHAAGYSNLGRTEVEPMPADPDFKSSGVWWRHAIYPLLAPADVKGSGILRQRYWDASGPDAIWVYIAQTRRMRRLNEALMSSSLGLNTWDLDHAGGFNAKPQEYTFKYLGDRNMLGCAHATNAPALKCTTDGGATACPDDWEMRHLYIVEITPRPKAGEILQSKTIGYMDSEMWFNPYVDSYDRRGQLWKTQVYLLTYRDRPVPDAHVAIYPFKREFVLAASSADLQSAMVTTCYLPGHSTPERECWYINMGATDKNFFTSEAMARAGH